MVAPAQDQGPLQLPLLLLHDDMCEVARLC
jgi:hypothetical protein